MGEACRGCRLCHMESEHLGSVWKGLSQIQTEPPTDSLEEASTAKFEQGGNPAPVLAVWGTQNVTEQCTDTGVGAASAGTGSGDPNGAFLDSSRGGDGQPGPLGAERLGLGLLSPAIGASRCWGVRGPLPCFLSEPVTLFPLHREAGTCERLRGTLAGFSASLGFMAQEPRSQKDT